MIHNYVRLYMPLVDLSCEDSVLKSLTRSLFEDECLLSDLYLTIKASLYTLIQLVWFNLGLKDTS